MAKLIGIPASPGVAIGRVLPMDRRRARVPRYHVAPDQIDIEISRLDGAVRQSVEQLNQIRQSLGEGEQGDILDAHRMMADDPTLLEGAKQLIRDDLLNAEWAMRRMVRDISEKLGSDGYLAEPGGPFHQGLETFSRALAQLINAISGPAAGKLRPQFP